MAAVIEVGEERGVGIEVVVGGEGVGEGESAIVVLSGVVGTVVVVRVAIYSIYVCIYM